MRSKPFQSGLAYLEVEDGFCLLMKDTVNIVTFNITTKPPNHQNFAELRWLAIWQFLAVIQYSLKEERFKRTSSKDAKHHFYITKFLDAFSRLYKRVCPSESPLVCPSVCHTRVEFLGNGLHLNKRAYGTSIIGRSIQHASRLKLLIFFTC